MCIRDRMEEALEAIAGDFFKSTHKVGGVHGLVSVGLQVMPVSYTHLRAHETVLDLVCRLLLEKKKHPRY